MYVVRVREDESKSQTNKVVREIAHLPLRSSLHTGLSVCLYVARSVFRLSLGSGEKRNNIRQERSGFNIIIIVPTYLCVAFLSGCEEFCAFFILLE